MIRKTLVIFSLIAASGAQIAIASDGTINFEGVITSQTCTINSPPTVVLPKIPAGALKGVEGGTAGLVDFTVDLTACTGSATTAAAFFEGGAGVDVGTGHLLNTGTASGVEMQLVDTVASKAIRAGDAAQMTETTQNDVSSGAVSMNYGVQYIATSATPGPGTVIGSVTYSINYQ
ncbi:type 1 fimbrial protein [Pseudomonas plecoglossicida]|nr:type 1 fimbrial protein [Pseudomonas plecoglossicida]RYZ51121.1 MAG: type 1 fimbrial protein [Sphingobacteriales bacterium]